MISCNHGRSRSHNLTLSIDPANVNWPSSLTHNFCAGVVSGGVVTDIYKLNKVAISIPFILDQYPNISNIYHYVHWSMSCLLDSKLD
jgi:hypothetical protein